ncbi:MAG TPA: hypothetical protein VNX68_04925 [Nitrosopumilaceae archaeon]|jgi:hypothetical protein|nr:hypothetical protein [Nitrosopumilaceae archaeon]
MTKKEKLFLAELLEMASDEFSNHTCNDMPEELLKNFTDKEKESLIKEYHEYNGDPEEIENSTSDLLLEDFDCMPDWSWMSFFAYKLKEE